MSIEIVIPIVLLSCGISIFFGWYLNSRSGQNKVSSAREQARKVLADAEKEADTLKREKPNARNTCVNAAPPQAAGATWPVRR